MSRMSDGSVTLTGEPRAGQSFRQLLFSYLYRWDASTIRVAQSLAVLGDNADPALVGGLTGLDLDRVRQCLDSLSRASLLDSARFRHPAVRAVLIDSIGHDERMEMHLTAARLLHEAGRPPVEVARHLGRVSQRTRALLGKVDACRVLRC